MTARDHGGGIDQALLRWGGDKQDWLDLSTGINPVPYPDRTCPHDSWTTLPDEDAQERLLAAARRFWSVPDTLDIVAAPGASALIATIPSLWPAGRVDIPHPTYNEHAAAFKNWGWTGDDQATTRVLVNPNNPDGRLWSADDLRGPTVVDESFCDVCPERSLLQHAQQDDVIVLKSFGKFWGLAGLRLGFAICLPDIAQNLRNRIGPWAVSGPALHIGTAALRDDIWAKNTRVRLKKDAARMDAVLTASGLEIAGGTDLFRLVRAQNATSLQDRLAAKRILVRIFPYSGTLVRFGLPGSAQQWARLDGALA